MVERALREGSGVKSRREFLCRVVAAGLQGKFPGKYAAPWMTLDCGFGLDHDKMVTLKRIERFCAVRRHCRLFARLRGSRRESSSSVAVAVVHDRAEMGDSLQG